MFAVLDTNVIVSAILSPNGKPAEVFRRIGTPEFILCCDERILQEYKTVLPRPKFNLEKGVVESVLKYIKNHALFVTAPPLDVPFADESDKKFYEVAKHCNAVLITGNKKHYPDDPIVKTVQEI